jgi:excinuclease UvrABC ATPase subunit
MYDIPQLLQRQRQMEFRDVLEKMAATGYERVSCNLEVCKLIFVKKGTTTYQKSTGTTYDYR